MKTKHILTAIALPALLAACSQDAELSEALNQKDYSNIPTVDLSLIHISLQYCLTLL